MTNHPHRKINLVPLADTNEATQLKIREIRNDDNIRKWMYTDHLIGINEHKEWIRRISSNENHIFFAVMNEENTPLGVISLNNINKKHKTADWAYYLEPLARGGLGSALEYAFINFIFDKLNIKKLNCEVISENEQVIKLHKKFFFQTEGIRKSNIIKNKRRIDVHLLGITKGEWNKNRGEIYNSYHGIFEKFSISIHYKGKNGKQKLNPIDAIEMARARNNVNWMNILRLALEKAPETATHIIEEINKTDKEISKLAQKIAPT